MPRMPGVSRLPLLFAVAFASCSYPTSAELYDPQNPVASDDGGGFRVTGSTPAAGATDVTLGAALTLVFSDFPDPASVTQFGGLTLRSGPNSFDFSASVDLLARSVTLRPKAALSPGTQYTIAVGQILRSLSGAGLSASATVSFTTGTKPGGGTNPTPHSLARDLQPALDSTCAFGGCHDAITAAGGLSLAKGSTEAMLLAVPAAEKMDLARVKRNDSASSYFLRKLLGTPDIVGGKMPPFGTWTDEQSRAVSDWIDTGAQP